MLRKLRLEFPGAIYHVINRGNYRLNVFEDDGSKTAFEKCLFEACEKSHWRLHAHVIMSNHFHLALETPEGNLTAGMQWMLSTFSTRFNRLRKEKGHVFQGRYKALSVEPGAYLGRLCHYIHLNPVRAGLIDVAGLKDWRYGSYWWLWHGEGRPEFLRPMTGPKQEGIMDEGNEGLAAYQSFLDWQAREGPAGQTALYECLSRGWALAGEDFKKELLRDREVAGLAKGWEAEGGEQLRKQQWKQQLNDGMRRLGKTSADLTADRKSAPWKIALAVNLRSATQASNAWIAANLNMGQASSVSAFVSRVRNGEMNNEIKPSSTKLAD